MNLVLQETQSYHQNRILKIKDSDIAHIFHYLLAYFCLVISSANTNQIALCIKHTLFPLHETTVDIDHFNPCPIHMSTSKLYSLHPEDGGTSVLRNVTILHYYMVSQPRKDKTIHLRENLTLYECVSKSFRTEL
jgi:hypothetical protein